MADLTRWRTQMGRAAAELLDIDGAATEVRPGWWLALSGLPSADMNMALIHEADDRALEQVVDRIDALGCPTLLMFAGEATNLAGGLPPGWAAVGAMPIMTVELASAPAVPDSRVRRARPEDAVTISGLMSEAFEIDREHVEVVVARVIAGELPAEFWLLEDGGDAVSTVLSARVEDTVSLWCMATPPQFARRGHGRALLAAVLRWAAEDGATVGLLGATPAGEPLYRATGWTVIESWDIHLNANSAQFG